MRKLLVFLFIFIFSPVALVSGGIGKPEIDKLKDLIQSESNSKTVKDDKEEEMERPFSSWQTAEASYYDPMDSTQTKKNPDGVGTSGRKIKSGSISLGSSFAEDFVNDSLCVFIQVKNCNVKTPYGKGIFRVDDTMASRYNKVNRTHIDFFHKDLSQKLRRLGRFRIEFKLYKILKTADSYLESAVF